MNNFKLYSLSTLLVALTSLLYVNPILAETNVVNPSTKTTVVTTQQSSANSQKSDVQTSYSQKQNQTADNNTNSQPVTDVVPVVIHLPVGTTQVVIKCVEPKSQNNNTTNVISQGPDPVLPNPTMPAYKDFIVPTDGFHTPVITTFCPVRIVYDSNVHPILPGLGSNVTFSNHAPNLLGDGVRPFYVYPLYPQGVNPSRKGMDNAVGGNNLDFNFWPNPSSVPSNVRVTVTGVFKSPQNIASSSNNIAGLTNRTVFTGLVEQLRNPQQTLDKLHQIESSLQAKNFQASQKLWIESSVYAALLKPKQLDTNLYLVSFPTTNIFDLRSPFVPVSPANPQGYWPNPEPSVNVLVDSSGYYLDGQSNKSLNPLIELIPAKSKVSLVTSANTVDYTVAKNGGVNTKEEANTGSYKFPENTVPATKASSSQFSLYYITNEDLTKITSTLSNN